MPEEVLEGSLCERFGWTLEELDAQDGTRLLPDVAALNIHAALGRANLFLETQGRLKPSDRDWEIYKLAADAAAKTADG